MDPALAMYDQRSEYFLSDSDSAFGRRHGEEGGGVETQIPFPVSENKGCKTKLYGCGKCGAKDYRLTSYNMWKCHGCGSSFEYIPSLENRRPALKRVIGLKTCPLCYGWYFLHSQGGGYFCLNCQPLAEEKRKELVLAGHKRAGGFEEI